MVGSFYLINEIEHPVYNLSARTGGNLQALEGKSEPRLANRSMDKCTGVVRRLVDTSRPFARLIYRAFPKAAQQRLKSMIYVHRNSRLDSLFSSEYVTDFIKDYYHEDVMLFHAVREARTERVAAE